MIAKIKEIFESIQGEGLNIGEKQVFIRFAGCNLGCDYCDTEHIKGAFGCSEEELFDRIKKSDAKTISLTGGEPLLQSPFIASFLRKYKKFLNKNIYLETNGVLFRNLADIVEFVDTIGMDIKIQSATGEAPRFEDNIKFLKCAKNKAFVKVVFDFKITDKEIEKICAIGSEFNAAVVLQPVTPLNLNCSFFDIFNKFYSKYKNVRLIAQTQTFLGLQ